MLIKTDFYMINYMAYLADCVYFLEYSVLAWKTPSGRLILSATVYLRNKLL